MISKELTRRVYLELPTRANQFFKTAQLHKDKFNARADIANGTFDVQGKEDLLFEQIFFFQDDVLAGNGLSRYLCIMAANEHFYSVSADIENNKMFCNEYDEYGDFYKDISWEAFLKEYNDFLDIYESYVKNY